MFVRADNRSFQQELAQERDQAEEQPPPSNSLLSGFTAEDLSHLPAYAPPTKRKHSVGSSVATRGSSRNDLDDVDLAFDELDQFQDHQAPSTHYREFADKSPQSNKLGGIVESLANCRTNEDLSEKQTPLETQPDVEHGTIEEMQGITTSKSPEMQERTGGFAPFLGRPGHSAQSGAVDMMDIDLDAEQHEGDLHHQ